MQVTHYNDDCYIEYGTRVNGPDDKWHDNMYTSGTAIEITLGTLCNLIASSAKKVDIVNHSCI